MARTISKWELNYRQRQAAINRWARAKLHPRLVEVEKIVLYTPSDRQLYLRHSPCEDCPAAVYCDEPCQAYLQWYDAKIQLVREMLAMKQ